MGRKIKMGRKTKSLSSIALVALCAGVLIAVLVGASPAPGAPPPGCGGNTDGGGLASNALRPSVICPTVPTPPPPGATSTGTSTTTTTTSTGTTTAPTSTNPTVSTPGTGTVQSTTPGTTPSHTRVPTLPVNVISSPTTTSTASVPPIAPANVITPPAVVSVVAGVATKAHHAKKTHHRSHHKHHKARVRHHKKAVVIPPPTPKPHLPPPKLPASVKVTSSIPPPQKVRFNAKNALAAGALGGFLVLLLAFTSEIFNKTYDENEEEIHGLLTRMGMNRHHLTRAYGVLFYALVGGALLAWLALGEGSDGNPLAVAVALLVALPIVTFAFEFPAELYLRTRSRIPGRIKVLPTALLVAFVCALVSRAIHLEPAYLYGVFAGYAAVRVGSVAEEDEGKSVLVGVATLAVISGASWFAFGALDAQAHGDHRGWFVILVSTAFFFIFVLGAESLVFGLMPLKYLNGSLVRRWRTMAWLIPQLLAAAFFVYVQMFHGSTKKIQTVDDLVRPFALFLGFGLLSFAFWGYFQWKGRPSRGFAGEEEEAHADAAAAQTALLEPAGAPPVVQPALLTAADVPGAVPPPAQVPDTPLPPQP
jgi:hypothetical protein